MFEGIKQLLVNQLLSDKEKANIDTYETRKIANTKAAEYTVSTAYTFDMGYETAVFIDTDMFGIMPVVVERYNSEADSINGHNKWIKEITKTKRLVSLGVTDNPLTMTFTKQNKIWVLEQEVI